MGRADSVNRCSWCSGFRARFWTDRDSPSNPWPKPQGADETDRAALSEEPPKEDILIVREIDPCLEENGINHYTDKYDLMRRKVEPKLVVRRGQSFKLILKLSRKYDHERDGISFIFTADDEDKNSYGQKTLIAAPLLRKADKSFIWNAVVEHEGESSVSVNIFTDPEAAVGRWKLDVDTKIIDGGAYCYSWEKEIYMLFNPWCKKDRVYLSSEEWRTEAVLNDTGIIWRGTFNRMKPVIWKYDQFDTNILDCSLYVLHEVGLVRGAKRSDPVKVARALAAAVNSADDDGVIMGNWSEDFSGGTSPTKWIGSKEILRKYYKKKKPVKFGQCWVFSGVLTTICRALGLPTRTVTNYSSAHDTQGSLTVDYFLNQDGDMVEDLNSDSVWTFHVWNEVWMCRSDVDEKFDGWQVIDATPQEQSEDIYQVGPASVGAIKHGDVLKPYDNGFVFAEVNADKVYWRYTGPNKPLKLLRKDTQSIGKLICTKAPGVFEMLDITYIYKHPEKTFKERHTMLKALQQSRNIFARYYLNEDFNDIHFDFLLKDDIKIGEPFSVNLVMTNRNETKDYKVRVLLRVDVTDYTGSIGEIVQRRNFDVNVKAKSLHEVSLEVNYQQYAKKLMDQATFKILCFANVEDTNFEYYAEDDFRVRKPDVKFSIPEKIIEGKEATVVVFLENSLPVPLKKGEFTVEAPGLNRPVRIKVKSAVAPGEKAVGEFKFTPSRSGVYSIAAKFVCREMDDCDGYKVIKVQYSPVDINVTG
ncbi:annulin [Coccinella septempunctata]|uniref:annulin n=1 Tax=Coccinella septempunctata TaxID=41139 RepID=UPI001D06FA22|nr:annulin [Coccinella septempunctata]